MKVNIKPYPTYIGPYQIVAPLRYIGVNEKYRDQIAEWLSNTWVNALCSKLYTWRGNRRVNVRIDRYDNWNACNTLAYVILPVLKDVYKNKDGGPCVADEDVPEHLRSTNAPPKQNEWDTDEYWFARWAWVLSEMIWAFEQINCDTEEQFWKKKPQIDVTKHPEDEGKTAIPIRWIDEGEFDKQGYQAYHDRIARGTKLFGIYYNSLWT